jgi:hypothetical protein
LASWLKNSFSKKSPQNPVVKKIVDVNILIVPLSLYVGLVNKK